MRVDWVVKLLDGEGAFTAEASNKLAAPVYTPYMPTTGSVAFPLAEREKPENRYDSDRFTVYANLTGLPALQIPSGGDGILPTGVSLLGRRFGEPELYGIARLLEEMLKDTVTKEVRAYGGI